MLKSLIGPVAGLLDKFIEDKDQKNQLAHDIATMAEKHAHESNMAQVDVNKAEAQHRSIFVAGWRPFIGWVCGVALAYHFILYPIVVFILASFPTETFTIDQLPKFDMDSLMTVLLGMLGLGGLRTLHFDPLVNGWVSFQDYIPQLSTSSQGQYYTFKNNAVWLQYSSNLYNNFYGKQYGSSVDFVFNPIPTITKTFKIFLVIHYIWYGSF